MVWLDRYLGPVSLKYLRLRSPMYFNGVLRHKIFSETAPDYHSYRNIMWKSYLNYPCDLTCSWRFTTAIYCQETNNSQWWFFFHLWWTIFCTIITLFIIPVTDWIQEWWSVLCGWVYNVLDFQLLPDYSVKQADSS